MILGTTAMNVYDFDKTIFYPDSSVLFVKWYYGRHPGSFLKRLGPIAGNAIRCRLGKYKLKNLKELVFSFLTEIEDIDGEVGRFWDIYRKNLLPWYLRQKREDDIIISASPEFLLEPICKELGVRLIATRMDKHTGRILSENNKDTEKVKRFYAEYPGAQIDGFYSDSLTDTPMALEAKRAFRVVNKDQLIPWPNI